MRIHKVLALFLLVPTLGLFGVQGASIPNAEAGTCCSCAYGPPATCMKWQANWNGFQYVCTQVPAASGTACSDSSQCITSGTCNGSGTCVATHGDYCQQDNSYICDCVEFNCYFLTSSGWEGPNNSGPYCTLHSF